MGTIKDILEKFSVLFFTKRCEICGETIEYNQSRCDECKDIKNIAEPICLMCAYSKNECECKKHKNEYLGIVAPFYYENGVRTGLNRFKEQDKLNFLEYYSSQMLEKITIHYSKIKFDYITFVPMQKADFYRRGFNQSELLANEISKKMNVEVKELLVKTQKTQHQKDLHEKERKGNVFGAFDLKKGANIEGKNILLIDDIKTTGSTLNECSKMLNLYGANSVYCATCAVTKRHNNKVQN